MLEGVPLPVVLDGLARWLPVTLLEGVHVGVLVQWLHVTLLEGVQAVVLLPLLESMLLVPLQALLEAFANVPHPPMHAWRLVAKPCLP